MTPTILKPALYDVLQYRASGMSLAQIADKTLRGVTAVAMRLKRAREVLGAADNDAAVQMFRDGLVVMAPRSLADVAQPRPSGHSSSGDTSNTSSISESHSARPIPPRVVQSTATFLPVRAVDAPSPGTAPEYLVSGAEWPTPVMS